MRPQRTGALAVKPYLMFAKGGILKANVPEGTGEGEMVRRVYLGQIFELRKKNWSLDIWF